MKFAEQLRKLQLMLREALHPGLSRLRGEPSLRHLEKRGLTVGKEVNVEDGVRIDYTFCHLIKIEDGVTIAPDVLLLAHDASLVKHGISRIAPIVLQKDCFIGAGAIIMPGVTVGEGVIVGAGGVVTRSVPARMVVSGVPCREKCSVDELIDRERGASER